MGLARSCCAPRAGHANSVGEFSGQVEVVRLCLLAGEPCQNSSGTCEGFGLFKEFLGCV